MDVRTATCSARPLQTTTKAPGSRRQGQYRRLMLRRIHGKPGVYAIPWKAASGNWNRNHRFSFRSAGSGLIRQVLACTDRSPPGFTHRRQSRPITGWKTEFPCWVSPQRFRYPQVARLRPDACSILNLPGQGGPADLFAYATPGLNFLSGSLQRCHQGSTVRESRPTHPGPGAGRKSAWASTATRGSLTPPPGPEIDPVQHHLADNDKPGWWTDASSWASDWAGAGDNFSCKWRRVSDCSPGLTTLFPRQRRCRFPVAPRARWAQNFYINAATPPRAANSSAVRWLVDGSV